MEAGGSSILIEHSFIQEEILNIYCVSLCPASPAPWDEVFLSLLHRAKVGNLLGHISPNWRGRSHCPLYGFRSPKEG